MGIFVDLTGQRFSRLTVLERVENYVSSSGKSRHVQWKCICSCGNPVIVSSHSLKSGHTKSCGCLKVEKAREAGLNSLKDLTGKRFGRLVVLRRGPKYTQPSGQEKIIWVCKCDCGNKVTVQSCNLRNGNTKSCGCYHIECVKGENNYNWKGGITELHDAIRTCSQNLNWKEECRERDNYTCQKCGKRDGGKLPVHHKKSFSLILEESGVTTLEEALEYFEFWNIDNGISLCEDCHKEFHSIYGY